MREAVSVVVRQMGSSTLSTWAMPMSPTSSARSSGSRTCRANCAIAMHAWHCASPVPEWRCTGRGFGEGHLLQSPRPVARSRRRASRGSGRRRRGPIDACSALLREPARATPAGYPPRPMSRRAPAMMIRRIQLLLAEGGGRTRRYRPGTAPTVCSPGALSRLTSSAVSALTTLGTSAPGHSTRAGQLHRWRTRSRRQERGPRFHQRPTLVEQVAAAIGRLDGVADLRARAPSRRLRERRPCIPRTSRGTST